MSAFFLCSRCGCYSKESPVSGISLCGYCRARVAAGEPRGARESVTPQGVGGSTPAPGSTCTKRHAGIREAIGLKDGEEILAAYAQTARGPGWSNTPLWVIVRRRDGALAERCIQPQDMTARLVDLYPVAEAVHAALLAALRAG